jgi:phosphoribosylanthranilate isomerase
VGVFVNEPFEAIMEIAKYCGLGGIQLHGMEPPELVGRLLREGLTVIKGLYLNGEPSVKAASLFGASAYLVECSAGKLPGGNARAWDWSGAASALPSRERLILAGGLTPENVGLAIQGASPDAVDVSSGVEASPGRKDLDKVKRFLEAARASQCARVPRRVF